MGFPRGSQDVGHVQVAARACLGKVLSVCGLPDSAQVAEDVHRNLKDLWLYSSWLGLAACSPDATVARVCCLGEA